MESLAPDAKKQLVTLLQQVMNLVLTTPTADDVESPLKQPGSEEDEQATTVEDLADDDKESECMKPETATCLHLGWRFGSRLADGLALFLPLAPDASSFKKPSYVFNASQLGTFVQVLLTCVFQHQGKRGTLPELVGEAFEPADFEEVRILVDLKSLSVEQMRAASQKQLYTIEFLGDPVKPDWGREKQRIVTKAYEVTADFLETRVVKMSTVKDKMITQILSNKDNVVSLMRAMRGDYFIRNPSDLVADTGNRGNYSIRVVSANDTSLRQLLFSPETKQVVTSHIQKPLFFCRFGCFLATLHTLRSQEIGSRPSSKTTRSFASNSQKLYKVKRLKQIHLLLRQRVV